LALRWALNEAVTRSARLQAVAVFKRPFDFKESLYLAIDEERLAGVAKDQLAQALADVTRDKFPVEIESLVIEGDPAQVLCAHSGDVDLLVIGSRGHGTFAELLLGSVSSKCAHRSRCPVVIVPHHTQSGRERGTNPTDRILVGVDGSDGSRRALRWALGEASARNVGVDAACVWRATHDDDMSLELRFPHFQRDRAEGLERTKFNLEATISELASEGPTVEIVPHLLEGDPGETLCEQSTGTSLLAVGSRGHGRFTELPLGSVSSKCAHHSHCPVVIVPS
jgi:nucleotide-binding universal stress UspA family protein